MSEHVQDVENLAVKEIIRDGSIVTIRILDGSSEISTETYRLVSSRQVGQGDELSISTPIGEAIKAKSTGDIVSVDIRGDTLLIEIIAIE